MLYQALTAPFVIRFKTFTETGLMPASLGKGLKALPNYAKWSEAVTAQEAVTYIYDGPKFSKTMAERLQKMKAEGK